MSTDQANQFQTSYKATTWQIIKMNLITAFLFPFGFYRYGYKAKKLSWLLFAVAYSIPFFTVIHLGSSKADPKSAMAVIATLLLPISWISSIIHTNKIRNIYYGRLKEFADAQEKAAKEWDARIEELREEQAKNAKIEAARFAKERAEEDARYEARKAAEQAEREKHQAWLNEQARLAKEKQEREERIRSERQKQEEARGSRDASKSSNNDPYAILGISRSASQTDIKNAYRKLMAQYHPDKVSFLAPEFQELATRKSKSINDAYDQLKERKAS